MSKRTNQIDSPKSKKRKVRVLGHEQWVNVDTGEAKDVQNIEIEDGDFNFDKVWLTHLAYAIDLISNQKIKVLMALWKLKNYENKVTISQPDLAKQANVSLQTVNRTMRALIEAGFVQMIYPTVYRINPNIVFKGSYNNRLAILIQYKKDEEEKDKNPKEEKELVSV
jgi:DNA-binding XRE family transcriptional regulator